MYFCSYIKKRRMHCKIIKNCCKFANNCFIFFVSRREMVISCFGMNISRREMNVSRCEMKKWAYSFLFHSLFFIVLRRTFWQFSVGFFFSFYLLLWGLSLYIQVSQAQLSGVQECRSDASLRSVDDSAACMVCFVCHRQSYCLHSCLLHSYTPKNTLQQLLYLRKLN